ncbi:hypothetical protein [Rhodococcus qingshengii]|uniref:Uncharacterized protein n=1 Tax=Rhodococcus qingshengii TaxID=334542 RepID=A0A2A5JEY0_RHOSG|nr:hypothetical protein [Rhodococcus qingshengii]PCK27837.1 hypothetical protein CHR55_10155 [Rhodococcus qingshengii]
MIKDRSTAGVVVTAPDPGLTDLIAAEVARHRLRYGSEDAYNGERWLCTACPWLVEADTGSRPNATVIQAHAVHVAERLKLVVEQHTNGRITELESELEKYHAEEREDLEWERFCAQQDVRCTECGLRYGERKDYTCPHIGDHTYDADELRAASEGEHQ